MKALLKAVLLSTLVSGTAQAQTNAGTLKPEPDLPSLLPGEPPDPGDLLRDLLGRLAPGEVDVRVPGRDPACRRRRAPEVDGGHRVRDLVEDRVLHPQVLALEGDGLAAPQ